jgi:hypothetical protein
MVAQKSRPGRGKPLPTLARKSCRAHTVKIAAYKIVGSVG